MPTVRDLMDEIGTIDVLCGPIDSSIRCLSFAEEIAEIEGAGPGAVVFVGGRASHEANGYRLDIALRRAGNVAALVLHHGAARVSPTARSIAERQGIALMQFTEPVDLASAIVTCTRLLDGGLGLAVERASRVVRAVDAAERSGTSFDGLVAAAQGASDVAIELGRIDARMIGAPSDITGWDGDWLQAEATPTGATDTVTELMLWRIAAALTKRSVEQQRAEHLTVSSAGQVIARVLDSSTAVTPALEHRARALGIAVEAWHVAVDMEFENLQLLAHGDNIVAYELGERLCHVASRSLSRHVGAHWTLAPQPAGAILVRTRSRPFGHDDHRAVDQQLREMADLMRADCPGLKLLCGVGSGHQGVEGMRVSASEARIALLAARHQSDGDGPAFYDAPGMRRLLLEWYASPTVRESVDELLAPLKDLGGPAKQLDYLHTLRVYLDHNRSVSRSADELSLHRNTVTYRIERLVGLLAVDLDDPPQRLALHLACRARTADGRSPAGV